MTDIKTAATRILTVFSLLAVAFMLVVSLFTGQSQASGVVQADDDSYYNEVVRSDIPVILEFSAKWCPACRKMEPVLNKLAGRLSGKVKVVRMDVDKSRNTTSRFRVKSIPAFFYMEDGSVKGEAVGAMSEHDLLHSLGVPDTSE